jgi:hypothetical protein
MTSGGPGLDYRGLCATPRSGRPIKKDLQRDTIFLVRAPLLTVNPKSMSRGPSQAGLYLAPTAGTRPNPPAASGSFCATVARGEPFAVAVMRQSHVCNRLDRGADSNGNSPFGGIEVATSRCRFHATRVPSGGRSRA